MFWVAFAWKKSFLPVLLELHMNIQNGSPLGLTLLAFKMAGLPFTNSHLPWIYFSLPALPGSCNSFVVVVWGKSPHTFWASPYIYVNFPICTSCVTETGLDRKHS